MQGKENLIREVLSGFVLQGTTLNKFCKAHGIRRSTADKALRFQRNGRVAQALRKRLIEASTAQAITTSEV
jgi:hypothetical protein